MSGGEIDGNWEGQGGEVVVSGHIDDVSHGLVVSRWHTVKLKNIYAHDCMGHHINHAGNEYFYASDIRISSHISTNFPEGGARGDGITGVSKHIYIDNVQGYSSDDLIGLFPGATWVPGETNPDRLVVETITIRNIIAESKNDSSGNTRYTWHAVTAGCWNNAHLRNLDIFSVKGETQDGGVRVRVAPSSGDDLTLVGDIDNISIDNIYCYVAGKDTDQYETCPVLIGSHQQSMSLTNRGVKYKNITIRNVVVNTSGKIRAAILIGHINSDSITVSDVTVNFKDATDTACGLLLTGQGTIPRVNIDNVTLANFGGETDTINNARPAVRLSLGSTSVTSLRGNNITTRRQTDGSAWIGNVLYTNGFTNRVTLFGDDFIVNANDNFVSVNPARGCHFTDRFVGRVRRDPLLDGWCFDDFCITWENSNFGRPNSSNFPAYTKVSDWKIGTVIKVIGSPIGECTGYICTVGGSDPKWAIYPNTLDDSNSLITSSTLPTTLTPRVHISTSLIESTGFPAPSGELHTYTGAARPDRAGAYRELIPASGTRKYLSTWNNSTLTWNAWISILYA